jgi:DNA-binding MarR family transcriptional regulator
VPPRRDLLSVLFALTRALRRIEDDAAAVDQLTMWQYAVLALVEDAPANQTALAARLGYSKNRLVYDIDHLERLGLVRREIPPTDRRSNTITITSRGRTTRAHIQRRIHAAEDALLHHVPPSARKQFAQLAADITDGLHRQT